MGIDLFPSARLQDIGTWVAFTPVWIQGAATIAWTGTCHYTQTGKTVTAWYDLTATSAGSAGNGLAVTLPIPSSVPGASGNIVPIGAGFATVSTGQVPIVPVLNHNGNISFTRDDVVVTNYFGADPSITVAIGNKLGFFVTYEADTPTGAYAPAIISNRQICTSTTRPTGANLWVGLEIFETDTLHTLHWNGTAWCGVASVTKWANGPGNAAFSANTTISTVTMPDQGCSGVVNVYAQVRVDQSVGTDIWQAAIATSPGSMLVTNYDHAAAVGTQGNHVSAGICAQAAGAATTCGCQIGRASGTGTATTYNGNGVAPNLIIAVFTPDQ